MVGGAEAVQHEFIVQLIGLFLLTPREFPSHLAPGRLVFDPALNRPAAAMDRPGILGDRLLRR